MNAPEIKTMYRPWVKVLHGARLLEQDVEVEPLFVE